MVAVHDTMRDYNPVIIQIDINELEIINRCRTDFGDVEGLAFSIKKHGQIAPIVIRPYSNEAKPQKKWELVAGERRTRAFLLLGWTKINAILRSQLNALQAKEIELEENIKRKDLTWMEQCAATKQLDDIKRELYGDSQTGKDYGKGWGIVDTAVALGQSVGAVSQDIKLAKDMEEHPELAEKIKKLPKHAARKMLNQLSQEKRLNQQILTKELVLCADIRLGSAADLVHELADDSVDLWLTDPPFAVDKISDLADSSALYNTTSTNVGDKDVMLAVYDIVIPAMFKKMKAGRHFYMFHAPFWYPYLVKKMREVGFIVDDIPLIWNKLRVSTMGRDMSYMSCYEPILYGYKPPAGVRILRKPMKNVFDIAAVDPQKRVHPLQRPEELLQLLINQSTTSGELVVDTFLGSGSTIVAARKINRNAIGFEIDSGNYARAMEWMQKELSTAPATVEVEVTPEIMLPKIELESNQRICQHDSTVCELEIDCEDCDFNSQMEGEDIAVA